MNFVKPPSFSSVAYVLKFRVPDLKIRFRQAEIEAGFAGLFNGQSQQTNVPDQADPTQARIVYNSDTKSLAISQVGCQLGMNFEKSDLPIDKQLEVIKKNVVDFSERAAKVFSTDVFNQSGLVIDITYPSDSPFQTLHQYLADRFYSGPKLGEIASTQMVLGFKTNDLFLTLTSSVYESRQLEFPAIAGSAPIFLDVETIPIKEHGLLFKVDVNDRPRQRSSEANFTSANELFAVLQEFLKRGFEEFSGLNLM